MELIVIVIADTVEGSRPAVDTAWSARALGVPVRIVAPRGSEPWPVPEGVQWVFVDGSAGDAAALLMPPQGAILVLAPGERLVSDDWVAARARIDMWPASTPASMRSYEGVQQRLLVANPIAAPELMLEVRIERLAPLAPITTPQVEPLHVSRALVNGFDVAPLEPPALDEHLFIAASQGDPAAQELLAELCRIQVDRQRLAQVRDRRSRTLWTDDEPLVTIRINTYNRGQLAVDRSVASALRQTYRNIEVLVVGDCCDAATEAAMLAVDDPRVRFVNLAERGVYPDDARQRWLVAGTDPGNAGIALARGAWIAPCDDDDELTDDHVEVLLRAAQAGQYEMVYSQAQLESAPGQWRVVGDPSLREGGVCHGSVMYARDLRFMQYSPTCFRMDGPGDFSLWRRMSWAGVRVGFVPHITYVHYEEAREVIGALGVG